jgi:DNA invertase Pin-like site-specific DNA recombinase
VFAELERRLIAERTKAALAVKQSQGVRLGRRPALPEDLVAHINGRRQAGAGWSAIARELNEEGVHTAHGGRERYPATVRYFVVGNEREGAA